MDIRSLEIGKRYIFHTKSWVSQDGMVNSARQRKLIFRGAQSEGVSGEFGGPSVMVERGDGTRYLIEVATIQRIRLIDAR